MAPSFASVSSSVMAARLCEALHAPSSQVNSSVLPPKSLASRLIRSTASEAAPAMVRPPVHSPEIGRRMPIRMDPFASNVADCEETGQADKNEQNAQTTYRLLPVLSNPRAIPQLGDHHRGIEKRSVFFRGDALKGWTVAPAMRLSPWKVHRETVPGCPGIGRRSACVVAPQFEVGT